MSRDSKEIRLFLGSGKPVSQFLDDWEKSQMDIIKKFTRIEEFESYQRLRMGIHFPTICLKKPQYHIGFTREGNREVEVSIGAYGADIGIMLCCPDKKFKVSEDSDSAAMNIKNFPEAYCRYSDIMFWQILEDESSVNQIKKKYDEICELVEMLNEQISNFNHEFQKRILNFFLAEKENFEKYSKEIQELGIFS